MKKDIIKEISDFLGRELSCALNKEKKLNNKNGAAYEIDLDVHLEAYFYRKLAEKLYYINEKISEIFEEAEKE